MTGDLVVDGPHRGMWIDGACGSQLILPIEEEEWRPTQGGSLTVRTVTYQDYRFLVPDWPALISTCTTPVINDWYAIPVWTNTAWVWATKQPTIRIYTNEDWERRAGENR